jgi:DNA replication protein DnaC
MFCGQSAAADRAATARLWGGTATAVLTAAMLDLLMHHATVVQISGQNWRLKGKRKEGIAPKVST